MDIIDRDGTLVGRGFYNGHSRIALRVLSADPDEAGRRGCFSRRIAAPWSCAATCSSSMPSPTPGALIHSEGDGLSGLVVDRFADLLVVEYFSRRHVQQRE